MDLKAKHAELRSEMEQCVGRVNWLVGAISIVDEMIAEQAAPPANDVPKSTLDRIRETINAGNAELAKFTHCAGCPNVEYCSDRDNCTHSL